MKALVLFAVLLLAGCGKELVPGPAPIPGPGPIPEPEARERVVVAVFGAPWCSVCKVRLPEINRALVLLRAACDVELRLYLPTGERSHLPPTQSLAERYRDYLGLDASAHIDPNWQFYRQWVSVALALPGAAVLDSKMNLLKSYPPMASFNARDIAAFAARCGK